MRPFGSKPGIPSPIGVQDPVVLRSLTAIREAIEHIYEEIELIKRQISPSAQPPVIRANALPSNPPPAAVWRGRAGDVCDND